MLIRVITITVFAMLFIAACGCCADFNPFQKEFYAPCVKAPLPPAAATQPIDDAKDQIAKVREAATETDGHLNVATTAGVKMMTLLLDGKKIAELDAVKPTMADADRKAEFATLASNYNAVIALADSQQKELAAAKAALAAIPPATVEADTSMGGILAAMQTLVGERDAAMSRVKVAEDKAAQAQADANHSMLLWGIGLGVLLLAGGAVVAFVFKDFAAGAGLAGSGLVVAIGCMFLMRIDSFFEEHKVLIAIIFAVVLVVAGLVALWRFGLLKKIGDQVVAGSQAVREKLAAGVCVTEAEFKSLQKQAQDGVVQKAVAKLVEKIKTPTVVTPTPPTAGA